MTTPFSLLPCVDGHTDALAAVAAYADAKRRLRQLNVLRSERVLGEIGEWYFVNLFGGDPAPGTSQKGWDVLLDGKRVQVKAHAKSETNGARWTELSKGCLGHFDVLYVIVFTQDLVLSEIRRSEGKPPATKIVNWDGLAMVSPCDIPKRDFFERLKQARLLSDSMQGLDSGPAMIKL